MAQVIVTNWEDFTTNFNAGANDIEYNGHVAHVTGTHRSGTQTKYTYEVDGKPAEKAGTSWAVAHALHIPKPPKPKDGNKEADGLTHTPKRHTAVRVNGFRIYTTEELHTQAEARLDEYYKAVALVKEVTDTGLQDEADITAYFEQVLTAEQNNRIEEAKRREGFRKAYKARLETAERLQADHKNAMYAKFEAGEALTAEDQRKAQFLTKQVEERRTSLFVWQ